MHIFQYTSLLVWIVPVSFCIISRQKLLQWQTQILQLPPLGQTGQFFWWFGAGDLRHDQVQLLNLFLEGHQVQILRVAYLKKNEKLSIFIRALKNKEKLYFIPYSIMTHHMTSIIIYDLKIMHACQYSVEIVWQKSYCNFLRKILW